MSTELLSCDQVLTEILRQMWVLGHYGSVSKRVEVSESVRNLLFDSLAGAKKQKKSTEAYLFGMPIDVIKGLPEPGFRVVMVAA